MNHQPSQPEPELLPCPIAKAVAQQVLERSAIGVQKYGVNLTRKDLSHMDWLNHLQQELLDAANYVERLKQDTRANTPPDLTKGGDVQMRTDNDKKFNGNELTSPEMPSQSRGETASPDELEKAIERIFGLRDTVWRINPLDIDALITAAKQSRELREQLNKEKFLVENANEANVLLQDQSRAKDALVERLVEALNKQVISEHVVNCPDCIQALHFNLTQTANYFSDFKLNLCAEHLRLVCLATPSKMEALSDAAKLGFPKQKETK